MFVNCSFNDKFDYSSLNKILKRIVLWANHNIVFKTENWLVLFLMNIFLEIFHFRLQVNTEVVPGNYEIFKKAFEFI